MLLVSVLGKKYTNPSSDIIEVLAGLDSVDQIFGEFVGALDGIVRGAGPTGHNGSVVGIELRKKAVEVAMAVTAGAWGTGLGSYFIQRDMFPALMKVSLLSLGVDRYGNKGMREGGKKGRLEEGKRELGEDRKREEGREKRKRNKEKWER